MSENIKNLILEHLKKIQAELTSTRERDRKMFARMGQIESGLARITRD